MSENENKMSDDNQTSGDEQIGISNDKLPQDLVPSDDNPLAGDLDDDADVEDLLTEGKNAVEMDSDDASEETTPDEDSSHDD